MRTDYLEKGIFQDLLGSLTEENRLVLRWMILSGMRITDALEMTWQEISLPCHGGGPLVYTERKTGKTRTVTLPLSLCEEMQERQKFVWRFSPWVFPGRDPRKHRTRQAVWKDLKNAARYAGLDENLGTHTARKIYAVTLYNEAIIRGDRNPLETVQKQLNHDEPAVTVLYALADILTAREKLKNHLTD